jgi:zinc transport system permease protein
MAMKMALRAINMIEAFLIKALVAGMIVAIVSGAMGCFVVWRRMAYFGDSLAHSALLGIAMGVALNISHNLAVMLVCICFALILMWLQRQKVFATDTLLGIMAHAALSIGVITIGLLEQRIDLHGYLFGDILTVSDEQLWWLAIGGAVVLVLLVWNWSSLVLMTIHEDLAMAENVPVFRLHVLLTVLMTIVIAVSIKIVGILLIASMLVIAPATARQMARSPGMMAILACLVGVLSVIVGVYGSFAFDTPSGPSIVATLAAFFMLLFPITKVLQKP